jgi:hypothetical protein
MTSHVACNLQGLSGPGWAPPPGKMSQPLHLGPGVCLLWGHPCLREGVQRLNVSDSPEGRQPASDIPGKRKGCGFPSVPL